MRVSEIIGKPIVSGDKGERYGQVRDLLVDAQGTRIVGLVVGQGLFSAEHVLRYTDVKAFGADVIVTGTGARMIGAREWHARGIDTPRSSALQHRRVITDRGRYLGSVKDMFLDDETGEIEAYDIAGSAFAGLIERRDVLPHTQDVVVGPAAIVVPDVAARAVQERGEDVTSG